MLGFGAERGDVGAGIARPDRARRARSVQSRPRAARSAPSRSKSSFVATTAPGEDDPRLGQRGRAPGRPARARAPSRTASVSATLGAYERRCRTACACARRAPARWRARGRRGRRSAPRPRGSCRRRRPPGRRCRRRSGRRPARGRARRSAPRPAARRPTGSAGAGPSRRAARAHERRQQPRVDRSRGGAAVERQRPAARARAGRRRCAAARSPRRSRRAMRPRSRPASWGRRRPSDSTNRTRLPRASRDIRWCWLVHSSVVPVGEADADDVAAPQGGGSGAHARGAGGRASARTRRSPLVVLVAADVEPVVGRGAPPHDLAGGDQAQDEVGEVEALAGLDLLERPRARRRRRPCSTS